MNMLSYKHLIIYSNIEVYIMAKNFCTEKEHSERVLRAKKNMPDENGIETAAKIFKALGEPTRLKIILALMEGELCVYHIVDICGGTQSGISHHLRILSDNKIVKARRDEQNIIYSIADDHIRKIIEMSEAHLSCKI